MKTLLFIAVIWSVATLAQSDTASVDGHQVYYEIHGNLGASTPVLMLHGAMMSFESSFASMLPALADNYPVIGVEQQGHGHTELYDEPISLETMRRDTVGVLDALAIDKAHVVGYSAGGMLALDLAINAPERVASVVAISAASNPDGFVTGIIQMQKDPDYQVPPDVLALMPSEDDFARMSADIADKNPGGVTTPASTMRKLTEFITSDWGWPDEVVAEMSVPVLVVSGDTDFILPEHTVHVFRTIPKAQLAILPNTTHQTILEHPSLPVLIEGFLGSLPKNVR